MTPFLNFPYHADQIYTFNARRILGYLALAMGLTMSTANHGFTQTGDVARQTMELCTALGRSVSAQNNGDRKFDTFR